MRTQTSTHHSRTRCPCRRLAPQLTRESGRWGAARSRSRMFGPAGRALAGRRRARRAARSRPGSHGPGRAGCRAPCCRRPAAAAAPAGLCPNAAETRPPIRPCVFRAAGAPAARSAAAGRPRGLPATPADGPPPHSRRPPPPAPRWGSGARSPAVFGAEKHQCVNAGG